MATELRDIEKLLAKVKLADKAAGGSSIELDNKKEEKKIPLYYPEYPKIVKIARHLSYHYDADVFPAKILHEKAPNQSDAEWTYAKKIYKPKTVPFWGKAESSISRIWNQDNFTVTWEEDEAKFKDNPSKKYFLEEIPFYRNIFRFFESIATPMTLRDPNSVLAIKPDKLPTKLDKDGNLENDQSQLISPKPFVFSSAQIVAYEQDVHLMVLLFEKSIVTVGGDKKLEGKVYEFYDNTAIWRIFQFGEKTDNTFKIELFYKHDLGKTPFMKLSGKPVQKNGLNYNISYFQPAVPGLDDAIANFSTLTMSIYSQAFPQRWEVVDRCKAAGCLGGKVRSDSDGKWSNCTTCKGTGKSGKHSPTGVHQVELPEKLGDNNVPPTPSFGYVSPDPSILEFLDNYITKEIVEAFSFLNIDVSNSNPKGSETALGKKIDREEFFSFLILLSNQMFALLGWTINIMGNMRYQPFKDPEIIKPSNFTIRTFKEITEEIAEAQKAGIPAIAITKLLEEYAAIRFNTDKTFGDIMDLAVVIDKLIISTQEQIISDIAVGIISKKDAVIHQCFLQFVEQGILEDKDFLDQKIEKIVEFIDKKATEKLALIGAPGRTVEDILAPANDGT